MKLLTKYLNRTALSLTISSTLLGCSGGGQCNTTPPTPIPPDVLSLSMDAPNQYPSGIPVTAYLTMTNTSNIDGTNLTYTVPAAGQVGNYTGVNITVDPLGAGQNCTSIMKGDSCVFTALIPAGSNPGSFTVTATPNVEFNSANTNTSSITANSISVTANLGLVDTPNTENKYYILPANQTIVSTENSTDVYISVWIKEAATGFKLVDETGAELSFTSIGNPTYAVDSVNSYKINIPAGKTIQRIQALSNTCTTLNDGNNNNTACSNNAIVNLAPSGAGILDIQPSYFNVSEHYSQQVVTLTNIGTGNVTNIAYPILSAPFNIVDGSNSCANITMLTPNQSCNFTINYTAGENNGEGQYIVNYNSGKSEATQSTVATIPYSKLSTPLLIISPTTVSFTSNDEEQTITLTNNGTANLNGLQLPTLSEPLTRIIGGTCTQNQTLTANGDSCTYKIKLSGATSDGAESINFGGTNINSIILPITWSLPTSNGISINKTIVDGITTFTLTNTSQNEIDLGILSFTEQDKLLYNTDRDYCSDVTLAAGDSCTFQLQSKPTVTASLPFILDIPVTSGGSGIASFDMTALPLLSSTTFNMADARYVLVRYIWGNGDLDIKFGIKGANPALSNTIPLYQYVGYFAIDATYNQVNCITPTNVYTWVDYANAGDDPQVYFPCYGTNYNDDMTTAVYQPTVLNYSGDNTTGGEEDVIFDKNQFLTSQNGNYTGQLFMTTQAQWYVDDPIPEDKQVTVKFELYPDGTQFHGSEDIYGNTVWNADRSPIYVTYASNELPETANSDDGIYNELGPIECQVTGTNMSTCNFPSTGTMPSITQLISNNAPDQIDFNDGDYWGAYTATFNNVAGNISNNPYVVILNVDDSIMIGTGNPTPIGPNNFIPYGYAPTAAYCTPANLDLCQYSFANFWVNPNDHEDEWYTWTDEELSYQFWLGGELLGESQIYFIGEG